jgi:hypothetical protein
MVNHPNRSRVAARAKVTGHTPGPWQWEADNRTGGFNIFTVIESEYGHKRRYLADVTGPYIKAETNLANARLIAAAPELLAVLAEVETWLTNGDYDTRGGLVEMERLASIARSAIAKIKGF